MRRRVVIVVPQDPKWKPVDGNFFDAVRDSLDLSEVPAYLHHSNLPQVLRRIEKRLAKQPTSVQDAVGIGDLRSFLESLE